jgi:hypothetical protein
MSLPAAHLAGTLTFPVSPLFRPAPRRQPRPHVDPEPTKQWVKVKNPAAPAVRREAEEKWR